MAFGSSAIKIHIHANILFVTFHLLSEIVGKMKVVVGTSVVVEGSSVLVVLELETELDVELEVVEVV